MDPEHKKRTRVVKMELESPKPADRIQDTSGTDRLLDDGPRQRQRRRKYALWAVVAVALLAAAIPAARRWSRADVSVSSERLRFAEVRLDRFVRDVSAQGTVVAAVSPTLYAAASGVVSLEVQAGDAVTEGQILAVVDSPEFKTRLDRERSALETTRIELSRHRIEVKQKKLANRQAMDLAGVRLRSAEREMRRAEDSHAAQVISQHDYEAAVDELESAKVLHQHVLEDSALESERLDFETRTAALEHERQRLAVADLERRFDDLTVRSPVNGIVGTLAVDDRSSVAANQAVVTVVDLSALEVEVLVPESFGDDLTQGMAAEAVWGQRKLAGVLYGISPEVQNGQLAGRIAFTGAPPEGLKRNQRVSVRLVLDQRDDVLMVQRGQFYESGGGRVAYVVSGDFLERRSIQTGAASVGAVEILSGLEPGEQIVISSSEPFEQAETVLLSN